MDNKAVGSRIRSIRAKLGLTTEKFSALFSPPASKGTISKWENGHYLPNNERLKRIAELGGITVDELLYGSINDYIKSIVANQLGADNDNWVTVNHMTNMLLTLNTDWSDYYPDEDTVINAIQKQRTAMADHKEKEVLRFGKEIHEVIYKRNNILADLKNFEKLPLKEQHEKIDEVSRHLKNVKFWYGKHHGLTPKKAYEEYNELYNNTDDF